jgi:hypothetical protein
LASHAKVDRIALGFFAASNEIAFADDVVALEHRAHLVPGQASAGLHICIYRCIFERAL